MAKFTKDQLLNQIRDGVLSGSMSRSNAIDDPRARRGAQSEALPSQRFDPEFFGVRSDGVLTVDFENLERRLSLERASTDSTIPTVVGDYIGEEPFDTTSNLSITQDQSSDWYEDDAPAGDNTIIPAEGVITTFNDAGSDFTTSNWTSAGTITLQSGTYHVTSAIQINNSSASNSYVKGAFTDDTESASVTVYRFLHAKGANDTTFGLDPDCSGTMYNEFVWVLTASRLFELRMAAEQNLVDIERASIVIRKMA